MRLVERDVVRATPVFGTAQPVRGLSGALRTRAYAIPEHHARHWLLLVAADRVDVVESWIRERPARGAGAVAVLGGALVAAAWLARRR
jgi:hypothetical protein